MQKTVKIKFCDFSKDFDVNKNSFIDILKKKYNVELSNTPDYVFYSVFGREHLKYNCVRIFYTGECVSPDFNITDYAIGFDNLIFNDRYIRIPLYRLFQYRNDLKRAYDIKKHNLEEKDFCSFVCSNDNGMPERTKMFELLQSYKDVASGGRYRNNVGGPVPDKNKFLEKYRFNIAFENCMCEGYTTEKIVQAFAAGTIPIYYGNPNIDKEFNSKSFINCHLYNNFEEVLDEVKRINEDEKLYNLMLSEKFTLNDYLDNSDLEAFLYNIFDQDKEHARRRPINSYISRHENDERILNKIDILVLKPIRRVKNLFRRMRNKAI